MGRVCVLTVLAVLLAAGTGWAVEPDIKCESDKIKTAGKYAKCLLAAESKAVKKGVAQTEKLAKCDLKYDKKWDKIEAKADAKGPPFCPSSGDKAAIQAQVQQFVDELLDNLGCQGAEIGGACWFLGAEGANCDTTCASAGLSYDEATRTYAGSDGSLANCAAVMVALENASAPGADRDCGGDGLGCNETGFVTDRCVTPPTDSTSSQVAAERACACR